VISRAGGNLRLSTAAVPRASEHLEREGYALVASVFDDTEIAELAAEIERAFIERPPERGRADKDEFRYQMLNYSEACQRAIAHPRILEVIEPLLGNDCHVIANTAWRNPPDFKGGPWHCDAGPHIPRPRDVPWDDRIPYPMFAIGAHLMLRDCDDIDGPTQVVPGSHRSGRIPDYYRVDDPDFGYEGNRPVNVTARAGDVLLFASDLWHRGTAAQPGGRGRLFLQCHFGRRDIAQRIVTTAEVNQLTPEAIARATTDRAKTIVGLHHPYFYDG
jgi:ectoine hydroxylase-related dioxygenase (phytanoyl-CoA dioxygenase family)